MSSALSMDMRAQYITLVNVFQNKHALDLNKKPPNVIYNEQIVAANELKSRVETPEYFMALLNDLSSTWSDFLTKDVKNGIRLANEQYSTLVKKELEHSNTLVDMATEHDSEHLFESFDFDITPSMSSLTSSLNKSNISNRSRGIIKGIQEKN